MTTGCHDLSDQFSAQLHQLSRRTTWSQGFKEGEERIGWEVAAARDVSGRGGGAPSASGVFATWIGIYLDTGGGDWVDWNEIAAGIIEDAFRAVASRALIAELDRR